MGESVVLKVVEQFPGKRKNITTDRFFTSLKLTTTLQAEKSSPVGTLRKTKLSPSAKEQVELFNTKVVLMRCSPSTRESQGRMCAL